MNKNINIKEIISKESNINLTFYENDKYLGIFVNNKSDAFSIIKFLKDSEKLLFDQLIDITAIDYPSRELRFDVRFYLVAILFLIFDLEVAFLFPWAVSLGKIGMFGFWSMIIFLFILTIGFIYEWKKGALEWE